MLSRRTLKHILLNTFGSLQPASHTAHKLLFRPCRVALLTLRENKKHTFSASKITHSTTPFGIGSKLPFWNSLLQACSSSLDTGRSDSPSYKTVLFHDPMLGLWADYRHHVLQHQRLVRCWEGRALKAGLPNPKRFVYHRQQYLPELISASSSCLLQIKERKYSLMRASLLLYRLNAKISRMTCLICCIFGFSSSVSSPSKLAVELENLLFASFQLLGAINCGHTSFCGVHIHETIFFQGLEGTETTKTCDVKNTWKIVPGCFSWCQRLPCQFDEMNSLSLKTKEWKAEKALWRLLQVWANAEERRETTKWTKAIKNIKKNNDNGYVMAAA